MNEGAGRSLSKPDVSRRAPLLNEGKGPRAELAWRILVGSSDCGPDPLKLMHGHQATVFQGTHH